VSILTTCAAHRNLCDCINLTVFFLIRISNSSFVFILHVPSLSNVGPCIFLSTLLSKASRRFCSVTVTARVTKMLDRLKLPSATAGGPGDWCSLVRYTDRGLALWLYKSKHLTYLGRGGEGEGVVSILWCRYYRGHAYRFYINSSRLAAPFKLQVETDSCPFYCKGVHAS